MEYTIISIKVFVDGDSKRYGFEVKFPFKPDMWAVESMTYPDIDMAIKNAELLMKNLKISEFEIRDSQ